MKLVLTRDQLSEHPEQIMRRAGYSPHYDRQSGRESFTRRLTRDFYPRFHVYLLPMGENVIVDLHLDQKRPRYAGVRAHSGEYDGQTVAEEMERIKGVVGSSRRSSPPPSPAKNDEDEQEGFLSRWFG